MRFMGFLHSFGVFQFSWFLLHHEPQFSTAPKEQKHLVSPHILLVSVDFTLFISLYLRAKVWGSFCVAIGAWIHGTCMMSFFNQPACKRTAGCLYEERKGTWSQQVPTRSSIWFTFRCSCNESFTGSPYKRGCGKHHLRRTTDSAIFGWYFWRGHRVEIASGCPWISNLIAQYYSCSTCLITIL